MGAFDFPAEKTSGVLVYSGGMDSTTLLHECRNAIQLCLSFNYGAKHNARELEFARANCKELGISHTVVELPFIEGLFRSDLLKSGGAVPEGEYSKESLKSTVVPFRNGIMLSIAAGVAESHKLSFVMLANHASDHETYPDCRPSFIESMGQAVYLGSDRAVSVIAPYTHLTKREIALRGKEISVDFSKSWSCYKGLERHCGRCSTCHERKNALAGFDNTSYLEYFATCRQF